MFMSFQGAVSPPVFLNKFSAFDFSPALSRHPSGFSRGFKRPSFQAERHPALGTAKTQGAKHERFFINKFPIQPTFC